MTATNNKNFSSDSDLDESNKNSTNNSSSRQSSDQHLPPSSSSSSALPQLSSSDASSPPNPTVTLFHTPNHQLGGLLIAHNNDSDHNEEHAKTHNSTLYHHHYNNSSRGGKQSSSSPSRCSRFSITLRLVIGIFFTVILVLAWTLPIVILFDNADSQIGQSVRLLGTQVEVLIKETVEGQQSVGSVAFDGLNNQTDRVASEMLLALSDEHFSKSSSNITRRFFMSLVLKYALLTVIPLSTQHNKEEIITTPWPGFFLRFIDGTMLVATATASNTQRFQLCRSNDSFFNNLKDLQRLQNNPDKVPAAGNWTDCPGILMINKSTYERLDRTTVEHQNLYDVMLPSYERTFVYNEFWNWSSILASRYELLGIGAQGNRTVIRYPPSAGGRVDQAGDVRLEISSTAARMTSGYYYPHLLPSSSPAFSSSSSSKVDNAYVLVSGFTRFTTDLGPQLRQLLPPAPKARAYITAVPSDNNVIAASHDPTWRLLPVDNVYAGDNSSGDKLRLPDNCFVSESSGFRIFCYNTISEYPDFFLLRGEYDTDDYIVNELNITFLSSKATLHIFLPIDFYLQPLQEATRTTIIVIVILVVAGFAGTFASLHFILKRVEVLAAEMDKDPFERSKKIARDRKKALLLLAKTPTEGETQVNLSSSSSSASQVLASHENDKHDDSYVGGEEGDFWRLSEIDNIEVAFAELSEMIQKLSSFMPARNINNKNSTALQSLASSGSAVVVSTKKSWSSNRLLELDDDDNDDKDDRKNHPRTTDTHNGSRRRKRVQFRDQQQAGKTDEDEDAKINNDQQQQGHNNNNHDDDATKAPSPSATPEVDSSTTTDNNNNNDNDNRAVELNTSFTDDESTTGEDNDSADDVSDTGRADNNNIQNNKNTNTNNNNIKSSRYVSPKKVKRRGENNSPFVKCLIAHLHFFGPSSFSSSSSSSTQEPQSSLINSYHQTLLDRAELIVSTVMDDLVDPTGACLIEYRNDTFLITLRMSRKSLQSRLASRFCKRLIAVADKIAASPLQQEYNVGPEKSVCMSASIVIDSCAKILQFDPVSPTTAIRQNDDDDGSSSSVTMMMARPVTVLSQWIRLGSIFEHANRQVIEASTPAGTTASAVSNSNKSSNEKNLLLPSMVPSPTTSSSTSAIVIPISHMTLLTGILKKDNHTPQQEYAKFLSHTTVGNSIHTVANSKTVRDTNIKVSPSSSSSSLYPVVSRQAQLTHACFIETYRRVIFQFSYNLAPMYSLCPAETFSSKPSANSINAAMKLKDGKKRSGNLTSNTNTNDTKHDRDENDHDINNKRSPLTASVISLLQCHELQILFQRDE